MPCRRGDCEKVLQDLDNPAMLPRLPASARAAARALLLKQQPPIFHYLSSWTYLSQLHWGKVSTEMLPYVFAGRALF